VVVAAAVVLIGLSWWYWPRGDARFVGRWVAEGQPVIHWEFYRNGMYAFVDPAGFRFYSPYEVDGGRLLIGSEPNGNPVMRKLVEVSLDLVADATSVRYEPGGIDSTPVAREILFRDANSLSVWDGGHHSPRRLTRLPE